MNKITGAVLAIAVLGLADTSVANVDWAAGATGNWTNGANWVGGSIPAAGDLVEFNGGNAVATIDSDVGTFAKTQTGDVAGSGTDTINVATGGSIGFSQLRLANAASTTSILNIDGGAVSYASGNAAIGYSGTGIINLDSGSFTSSIDLDLGRNSGSRGELNMSGGNMSVAADFMIASFSAPDNSGHFGITAGTAIIGGDLSVGMYGTGTAVLSGGSVTADRARVGGMNTGSGTLTVDADGLLTVGQLNVGGSAGLTGAANLNGGTVNADNISIGASGTLSLLSAASLSGFTNMSFSADGLLVWEGDHTADVATLVAAGTLTGSGGIVDINTLDLGTDYDQVFGTGDNLLVSKFDGSNTSVYTVIPEPATLGLVAAMGATLLFVRRAFRM
ncbi:PEP-CTERM sorting domain-containing protein [Pontiella sulfatireligans]|uniref:PEP-CTERM protein-sorting domain-containing protein n=1 Tax=Pontiella sulfatireligans TaxID=2750658 RepID=A0A6C2UGD4_9BACT|nr:PEP-CTERM sorting domain-containing protein [Pontiella sulfatireligans]VGO19235.1 hypothetical protein SCARR_01292 [Pontiella sulfatireligans]